MGSVAASFTNQFLVRTAANPLLDEIDGHLRDISDVTTRLQRLGSLSGQPVTAEMETFQEETDVLMYRIFEVDATTVGRFDLSHLSEDLQVRLRLLTRYREMLTLDTPPSRAVEKVGVVVSFVDRLLSL